ncbi:hypothetical protein Peur_068632 [Populus x canadensis]
MDNPEKAWHSPLHPTLIDRKQAQTPIQHVFAPSSHTKLSHLSFRGEILPGHFLSYSRS